MTSVTMALARLVDRRGAGVKSFLPVCHKAEWPSSSIRCDPQVFGLSSRLCFLFFLSFQCLRTIQKIDRENDTISWNGLYDKSAKDRSANDTSAKPTVRMPTVRRGQQCE